MLQGETLVIDTPEWSLPLLEPSRYKGAYGGRASGKSHFFAERLVDRAVEDVDLSWVCIREVQRSLKFSAKRLIEGKIKSLGVGHLFEITNTEIRRRGGDGIIIFEGMQDHTADSIKSLEGFDGAWVEEAQNLSHRSLELLDPTMRKPGSEIWFSWNPDQPDDAVEQLLRDNDSAIIVQVNYLDNPWCPKEAIDLARRQKLKDFERYDHIWLGGYNVKSDAQIFSGMWRVDEFEPGDDWDGPYQGGDFGFSQDPTCAVRLWIHDSRLWVEYDSGKVGLDLDKTPDFFKRNIPDFDNHTTRWDSARPESISYIKRHGLPKSLGVQKGKGSVEDGIEFLKTFEEIVIHSRCTEMQQEARRYSYVIDKNGDVTDRVKDSDNHRWDAIRYALEPMIRSGKTSGVLIPRRRR